MNTLLVRTLSAAVFALIVVTVLVWDPSYTFSAYTLCFRFSLFLPFSLLIAWGSLREYYRLSAESAGFADEPKVSQTGLFLGVFLVGVSYFFNQRFQLQDIVYVFPMLAMLLFFFELKRNQPRPFDNIGRHLTGWVWIVLPLMLATNLYFEKGGVFLFACLWLIWANDSGAYIIGSLLGRTPFLQRISPHKTWEGFFGGAMATLGFAFCYPAIPQLGGNPVWYWVTVGVVVVIASTCGDFVESLFKRSVGVKDSGTMMPGHGGFLDRFDSYLGMLPFLAFTLWLLYQVETLLLVIQYLG